MALRTTRTATAVGALGLALVVSACGDGGQGSTSNTSTAAAGGASATAKAGCENFTQYGDLTGKTITVYTSIVAPEDATHKASYKPFEDCTGAKIEYDGSKEFEAQLPIRVQSGDAPDIAYFPQPGLLQTIVKKIPDSVKPAPAMVTANVDANFDPAWKEYGSVDGTFYAAPLGSNVKSFVWYSPEMFKAKGYAVPTTWDEMIKLSDKIVADNPDGKVKPWCAGIGSGDATGWPVTDWIEDTMLRTQGPEYYDKWIKNEVQFTDQGVKDTFDKVGSILKNDKYVNGGVGDVKSIATTTFQDGGLPILKGSCFMHRQASFYAANFPAGTDVSENGKIWAFYYPAVDPAKGKPVLVGGEFVGAFSDRPEVQAFQAYLASAEWANAKAQANFDAKAGGWVSANKKVKAELFTGIDKLSVEILQDAGATVRFDGSDLMPSAVGAGTFWKGSTQWITGQDTQKTLEQIQSGYK